MHSEAEMRADRTSRHRQARLILTYPSQRGGGAHVSLFIVSTQRGIPNAQVAHHEWFESTPDLPAEEAALVMFEAFLRRVML